MDQKTKNKFNYKKYKIVEKSDVTPETVLLKIQGQIKHEPGQFFQVSMPHLGEATFAPCSDIGDTKHFDLCIRSAGSTTNQMVKLLPGDELQVRGPYGNSWPIGKMIGMNVVIVAGGMGIVPLRPLIFELARYRKEFKNIYIIAGFKTPEHVLFEQDFIKWRNKFKYLKVTVEKSNNNWWGETGLITEILEKPKLSPKDTIIAMCGPDIMFKYATQTLVNKEIPKKNIYVSMERRMECGVGLCQHCNIGKYLVCKDGPIFSWHDIEPELGK
jgi:anaerobic sulfite reductase subunit B